MNGKESIMITTRKQLFRPTVLATITNQKYRSIRTSGATTRTTCYHQLIHNNHPINVVRFKRSDNDSQSMTTTTTTTTTTTQSSLLSSNYFVSMSNVQQHDSIIEPNRYGMWVACNVYVSAGGQEEHIPILQRLVKRTQLQCQQVSVVTVQPRMNQTDDKKEQIPPTDDVVNDKDDECVEMAVVLVHAYVDPIYNRSSFHYAGTWPSVAQVVSDFTKATIDEFLSVQQQQKKLEQQQPHNYESDKKDIETNTDVDSLSSSSIMEVGSATTTASKSSFSSHPTIGLVDHISVMPLIINSTTEGEWDKNNVGLLSANHNKEDTISHAGKAARLIGQALGATTDTMFDNNSNNNTNHDCSNAIRTDGTQKKLNILWYGDAHRDRVPLAFVRREQTNFFQTGSLRETKGNIQIHNNATKMGSDGCGNNKKNNNTIGSCTIGAPSHFVENYNIRLNGYNQRIARTLTREIRNTFPGTVEALTLPYATTMMKKKNSSKTNSTTHTTTILLDKMEGNKDTKKDGLCYEVACNLLRPDLVSHHDVQEVVNLWHLNQQQKEETMSSSSPMMTKETVTDVPTVYGYRVGTNNEQCNHIIQVCLNSTDERQKHDQIVYDRVSGYLSP